LSKKEVSGINFGSKPMFFAKPKNAAGGEKPSTAGGGDGMFRRADVAKKS